MKSLTEITEDLNLFDDWMDKYAYLIDLGKNLPTYPEDKRTDAYIIPGCTSKVWLVEREEDGKVHLQTDSDAMIVKGLLALILAGYHGKTRTEIAALDMQKTFTELGLSEHLTPNRRSGFASIVTRIRGA